MDNLEDLTEEEKAALADWEEHFKNKYILVGSLKNQCVGFIGLIDKMTKYGRAEKQIKKKYIYI